MTHDALVDQCVYQASKAVVTEAVGRRVHSVRVDADGSHELRITDSMEPSQIGTSLPIVIAGPSAASLFELKSIARSEINVSLDLSRILSLIVADQQQGDRVTLADIAIDGAIDIAMRELSANQVAIDEIVGRLLDDGLLSGNEIRAIIARYRTSRPRD